MISRQRPPDFMRKLNRLANGDRSLAQTTRRPSRSGRQAALGFGASVLREFHIMSWQFDARARAARLSPVPVCSNVMKFVCHPPDRTCPNCWPQRRPAPRDFGGRDNAPVRRRRNHKLCSLGAAGAGLALQKREFNAPAQNNWEAPGAILNSFPGAARKAPFSRPSAYLGGAPLCLAERA